MQERFHGSGGKNFEEQRPELFLYGIRGISLNTEHKALYNFAEYYYSEGKSQIPAFQSLRNRKDFNAVKRLFSSISSLRRYQ
jgi:hypothetical protein